VKQQLNKQQTTNKQTTIDRIIQCWQTGVVCRQNRVKHQLNKQRGNNYGDNRHGLENEDHCRKWRWLAWAFGLGKLL
jgi:hypothetical protein